ncbi:hypothetical protein NIES4071_58990 [Calothrix sp. NIES-4071]|nr:hypothetical protein NIES4071_58990 [Calothrix sp. NIES-4071]BAZ60206.1 hypothetical protein NIES4105_58940 [Calothrix sp. NIES-4105]
MSVLRPQLHKLIEQMTDDELQVVWSVVYALHCDYKVLKAIQSVKQLQQPWDTLTHEEAVRNLTIP